MTGSVPPVAPVRGNRVWPGGQASPRTTVGSPLSPRKATAVLPDLRIDVPALEPDPVLLEQLSQLSRASVAPARPEPGALGRGRGDVVVVAGFSWLTGTLPGVASPFHREPAHHQPAPREDPVPTPDGGTRPGGHDGAAAGRVAGPEPGERPGHGQGRRSRTRTTASTSARPSPTRTTAPHRPAGPRTRNDTGRPPHRTTATTPARPSPTRTTATTPARPSPTRTTATTPARPSPTRTTAKARGTAT